MSVPRYAPPLLEDLTMHGFHSMEDQLQMEWLIGFSIITGKKIFLQDCVMQKESLCFDA